MSWEKITRGKTRSLIDSYTRTHQYRLTSNDLHISALCGHWMQSRGPAKSDVRRKKEHQGISTAWWWWRWWLVILKERFHITWALPPPTHTLMVWFNLVWFSGISTIVGYLMPNPVFTYILNMICKHILYTPLNDQTVLSQTIQLCISHLFELRLNVKKFYLTHR